ncbi:MAG: 23S rRNA (uracil(1939)-C(5))-methyltransferase RlmD [Clostridia bacterium]|nr:23S rRNA (uracil(1939)-C(5))-methyltransferase RlmD [Clostridia bacterium]
MNIKKNDIIELEITDLNNLGCGVGKTDDGVVVFVKGAVTGDRVTAKIIKVSSSFLVGKLEKILISSPNRADGEGLRKSDCRAPQSCGGCIYRNIKYEHELILKRDYVKSAFRKAGLPDVTVLDTAHTERVTGYRNKGQYPVREVQGRVRAGFFATKTHNLIPCEECLLQPDVFGEIVAYVTDFAEKNKIKAYDEEKGKGVLRHIYLRIAEKTGQIMVCLVINADKMPYAERFAEELVAKFPSVTSVMLNFNKKNTNVILGDRFECIGGVDYIIDELCGLQFKISAGSFYQVNRDGAELLYGLAKERAALTGKETVADLYCGAGTIGLSMAKEASRIVGVEIVDEAVECAKENAKLNGVENAYFFCGDASDTRGLLATAKDTLGDFCPDVVIIDPPRKGTTEELVNYLDSLGVPRIVYVSCNPDTLARDCKWFAEKGYSIGEVTPVDLFPGTGHVESVVCLERRILL